MLYYSTNKRAPKVPFATALLNGQAPDRGLYMPSAIPAMTGSELESLREMEYYEMAARITGRYIDDIAPEKLLDITREAYNFEIPIETLSGNRHIMRLDRGPTASFKDFAARMMGRLMNHYLELKDRNLLILTATSGDTGSAIADAFFGLDRIEVVVLFPLNEVTARQRKQMTTLGNNITIIGIDNKFDDCQALVKEAFADTSLKNLNLSSANSINIGRLIPQMVYYFYAWSKVTEGHEKVIFSVPSGNFGDMMGGVMAMRMGLPVEKFIIAVNENDEFPRFLETGSYSKIEPSINCISSAMNVGHPSNLARLTDLYGGEMDEKGVLVKEPNMSSMRDNIWSCSITDSETRDTIKEAWNSEGVLLEPHGAVGWRALNRYLDTTGRGSSTAAVSLETAHPAKFPEEIESLLRLDPELPPALKDIERKRESYETLPGSYESFIEFLNDNYL